MNFLEWINFNEGLQILHINPEDDWEDADQAYQIAKMVNIRPDRNKEPTIIAKNENDEVIGAAFTSWTNDHEASQQAGEPIAKWDFDVVVHPQWQGYEMVGMKLIKQAEDERKNIESMYNQKAYTRLWVVNPKLAKILQHPKYGYDAESEYDNGSAHLVKY
jgi:hypothetical protein